MIIGRKLRSPIYNGKNYKEIVNSFPFYLNRDDNTEYFDRKIKETGRPRICSGEDPDTHEVHFLQI